MTLADPSFARSRWPRIALAALLVATLLVGVYLVWPSRAGHKVVGYFTSAVGLYPGDDVRIVGVPVGKIDSIEPIGFPDITPELARESGFLGVLDLLKVAKHGRSEKIYLVRFHYVRVRGRRGGRRKTS